MFDFMRNGCAQQGSKVKKNDNKKQKINKFSLHFNSVQPEQAYVNLCFK